MEQLKKIYGTPHELLHVLALRLIGRRAIKLAQDHVVVPGDLSDGEYVFVAGLPALVFMICLAVGVLLLTRAQTPNDAGMAVAIIIAAGFAVAGTVGDLQLIWLRVMQHNKQP